MGFGGPVWHASVSSPFASREELRNAALRELQGVGTENEGQWEEYGKAFHVRRRLSAAERRLADHLDVKDVRNTPEYAVRRAAMQQYLPPVLRGWEE